jgi:DNA (cytosine-5)-methyltransferase 1
MQGQETLFPDTDLLPSVTLWDAISDLPPLEAGDGENPCQYSSPTMNEYQRKLRENSDVLWNHVAMSHSSRIVERFKAIQVGQSQSDVSEHLAPRVRSNGSMISSKRYDQNNRRLDPAKPSHTIPASFYANFVHPFQHRNFTPREGARIQSFPDQYVFKGKATVVSQKLLTREGRTEEKHLCQYVQIGNAVPPKLACAIGTNILRQI